MSKDKKTAMEIASAYLATRMRTVQDVRNHLRGNAFDAVEEEEAIKELMALGYLDDYAYSMRYYEYSREKKRGSLRAMRELLEKGVSEETAKNARADFLYEQEIDEFSDALEIASKEAEGKERDEKLSAKIARKLELKGFEKRDIIRVLEELKRSGSAGEKSDL